MTSQAIIASIVVLPFRTVNQCDTRATSPILCIKTLADPVDNVAVRFAGLARCSRSASCAFSRTIKTIVLPVVVLARATIDLGDATGWTPKVTVIWTFASARPHYLPSACLATRAETREVSTGCAIFRTISTLVLHVNVLIRCALTLGFGSQRETIVDAFNTFSSLIPTVSAHAFGAERTRIVTRVVLPVATRNQLDALKGGRDVEQALRSVNRFVVHGLVQERFWVPEAVALVCIGIVDPRLLTFKTIAGSEFAFHAVFHVARCAVVCPVIPLLKLNTFD